MRVAIALLFAIVVGGALASAQNPTISAPCRFTLRESAASVPAIVGDQDLVGRFRMIPQSDSPVEIGQVDLTKLRLAIAGPSFYEADDSEYAVVLRNRSDAPVYEIRGMLRVNIGSPASGTGSGWLWKGILMPGEAVRVVTKSGSGNGREAKGEVFLSATVDSVTFADCTFVPSRSYRWATLK